MERRAVLLNAVPLCVGAVLTVMSTANAMLSLRTGMLFSLLIIHLAGLIAVSVIVLVRREKAQPGRLPFYYYMGGVVGVATVVSSNYAFSMIGASLSVAVMLLGQTLFSVAADAAGLLGRKRYPLTLRSIPGIALVLAGVAVMAGDWKANAPAMLAALIAGATPGLSFILNSELGRRKGVFKSTWVNYIAGISTTLLILAVVRPVLDFHAAVSAGPVLLLGGGLLGVVVVASMNMVFPRISALSAALLMFCGQGMSGIVVDAISQGSFDVRKLAGTAVVLGGLVVNAVLTRKRDPEPQASL